MSKQLEFFDQASSSTTPTIGNLVASNLKQYANDAAYEAAESGAPTEGNIYYNTTDNVIRYYNGTSWISVVDDSTAQTISNKIIDGTSATGTNTVTTDALDVNYNNGTSGLTATDTQAAIDEVEGRVDTNETDISTNQTDIGNLETLSGASGATTHPPFTGTTIPDSSNTTEALQALETETELKLDASEKGAANGVAELDGSGKVPASQLPTSLMEYEGDWNADTNSPTLSNTDTGLTGTVYRVTTAGTTDFGAGNITFAVGDWVYNNGSTWEKSIETTLPDTDALPEGSTNLYYTEGRVTANTSVTANTAKVSADGSIDTHSDVDTTTVAPVIGQSLTWDGSNWVPGEGGGGGIGFNYVKNADAEIDTADTGTSANVTIAQSAVTPLRGTNSFEVTFSNIATTADYVEFDLNAIDIPDLGKDLITTFDYSSDSGVSTGDFEVFIRDVTAGTDTKISDLVATGGIAIGGSLLGKYQLDSTNTDYKIRIKPTFSFGTQRKLKIDNIIANTDSVVPGYIGSEWQAWTPTGTWTANTTYTGFRRRVGDTAEFTVKMAFTGTPTPSTILYVNLPSDITADSTKIENGNVVGNALIAALNYGSTDLGDGNVGIDVPGNRVIVRIEDDAQASNNDLRNTTPSDPAAIVSGDAIFIRFSVPVEGWKATNLISTTENMFKNQIAEEDDASLSHTSSGSWVDTSITFTPEVTQRYIVSGGATFAGNATGERGLELVDSSNTRIDVSQFSNPGSTSVSNFVFTAIPELTKGETYKIRAFQSSGGTLAVTDIKFYFAAWKDTSVFSVYGESELIESHVSGGAWPVASNVAFDITSITVPAGEWDISFVSGGGTGATSATGNLRFFVGTISGNNISEFVQGDSGIASVSSGIYSQNNCNNPLYNVTPNVTTTYYLKAWSDVGGTAGFTYYPSKISARKIK